MADEGTAPVEGNETLINGGQATEPAKEEEEEGGLKYADATGEPQEAPEVPDDAEKEAEQPEGAPTEYKFSAAEGMEVDASVISAFSEAAKELNLPQDKAQKVIDKVAPAMFARQNELLQKARSDWEQASTTDKEFGGAKLPENMAVAKRAMDTFGTPELKTLLNESGLGNHPEIIRAFYRAGLTLKQDEIVTGGAPKQRADIPIEDRLYPNMKAR